MTKTSEEWLKSIKTTEHTKGRENWYEAVCPLCGDKAEATNQGSNFIAEVQAKSNILRHIKSLHPDCIKDA